MKKSLITDQGRECTICGKFLSWDTFRKATSKSAPYKKQSRCIPCMKKTEENLRRKKQKENGITNTGRICNQCNTFKPWDEYIVNATKNKQFPKLCKACKNENKKNANINMKNKDWHNWKAGNMRSTWGTRIRLKFNNKGREYLPSRQAIKQWLIDNEPYTCYLTGITLDRESMEIDHKQPLTRGGNLSLDNLAFTSKDLNQLKGSMTEQEFISLLNLVNTWEDKGESLFNVIRRSKVIFRHKRKGK